jgi:FAD/FMN-containing dehydrogenase
MATQQQISGWGRFPKEEGQQYYYRNEEELAALVAQHPHCIARGGGRAYGDSALAPVMLNSKHFNHVRAFDRDSGLITVEAGLILAELLAAFVPQGWIVPVTPGTQFVSIGGMVASDVHGKNHHVDGSFGQHITELSLMTADGSIQQCSATDNADLFHATIGGMGLTGVVLTVSFRMLPIQSAWIRQETIRCDSLDAVMDEFEQSQHWKYTVAWIDCLSSAENLGRSVLFRGEHASRAELPIKLSEQPLKLKPKRKLNVPFNLPRGILNRWSVRAFNELYYRRAPDKRTDFIDYQSFFYPLDAIHNWNRIYGAKGFVQYQCVIPKAESREALQKLLGLIASAGEGSFLAVLKLFGPQDGLLSFPTEGYTLALDFPAKPSVFALLDRLDQVMLEHHGRIYLTKDARTSPHTIRQGYAELRHWQDVANLYDPQQRWQSAQSKRLALRQSETPEES